MRGVEPRTPVRVTAGTVKSLAMLGAVLSFAILAASALLRLNTTFDGFGRPHSTLPAAFEDIVRLVHRLAASGVGVLALLAAVLCAVRRNQMRDAIAPIAWIVVATVALAVIGPLTTGYKLVWVTVCNVAGGVVLLMAFCRLRAALEGPCPPGDALLTATLIVFLAHVATGAATSALGMTGLRWPAFIHAGTAMLATIFVGATLWDRRKTPPGPSLTEAMWLLLAVQVSLGIAAAVMPWKPPWVGFLHAMLSNLMAAGLASIAFGSPGRNPGQAGIA